MTDDIKVKVNSYGPGRPLGLVWFDPVSGKKKAKSSGTTDWREAERLAGELEKELLEGRYAPPSKITWADFRQRYTSERLASLSSSAQRSAASAFNHLERILSPDRLCKLTTAAMSRFIAKLREERVRESTIACYLRALKAALRWGRRLGLLTTVPEWDQPRAGDAKGRPITTEEYERMLLVIPKVRRKDAPVWERMVTGLWLSGLRLGEAMRVSWDQDAPFAVDLSGRFPAFRIAAAAQKARRRETLPMTPDFAEWLLKTPDGERKGPVFPLLSLRNGQPIGFHGVMGVLERIGRKAGVVVGTAEKTRQRQAGRRRIQDTTGRGWLVFWDGDDGELQSEILRGTANEADEVCRCKRDGKRVTVTANKFASAHDLRRSFGTRWAKQVMPAVLQRLMRHASIDTTMKYYVGIESDDVAAELWAKYRPAGNTFGNNAANQADDGEEHPAKEAADCPSDERV